MLQVLQSQFLVVLVGLFYKEAMSSVSLNGDTSGSVLLQAPAVAGSAVYTLTDKSGTIAPIVSGTAVTASGTSVDFNSIPSWVKRVTVMFSGVSTNGTSNIQIQIGSGSFTTSGYSGKILETTTASGSGATTYSSGYISSRGNSAGMIINSIATLTLITGNTWLCSGSFNSSSTDNNGYFNGNLALGGALDRVRITTVNGTDTFDAGSINILYE